MVVILYSQYWEGTGRQIVEFEAVLVFEESSRTGLHRETDSKTNKPNKNKFEACLIYTVSSKTARDR